MSEHVVSFGATLARPMSVDAAKAHLARLSPDSAVGTAHLIVMKSYHHGIVNVECLLDGLDPAVAIMALQVADQRLRKLHNLNSSRLNILAIDVYDADAIRRTAEALVDMCRASRVGVVGGQTLHTFDTSRENCVRAMTVALATAPLGSSAGAPALARG